MESINLSAGWIGILLGFCTGAVLGLFFYKEDWLGGYSSWPRRMTRLGHISFFGIGFINLGYAFTVASFDHVTFSPIIGYLLITGAISMPLICFLSAYKINFRHLFPLPVLSLSTAVVLFIVQDLCK